MSSLTQFGHPVKPKNYNTFYNVLFISTNWVFLKRKKKHKNTMLLLFIACFHQKIYANLSNLPECFPICLLESKLFSNLSLNLTSQLSCCCSSQSWLHSANRVQLYRRTVSGHVCRSQTQTTATHYLLPHTSSVSLLFTRPTALRFQSPSLSLLSFKLQWPSWTSCRNMQIHRCVVSDRCLIFC